MVYLILFLLGFPSVASFVAVSGKASEPGEIGKDFGGKGNVGYLYPVLKVYTLINIFAGFFLQTFYSNSGNL